MHTCLITAVLTLMALAPQHHPRPPTGKIFVPVDGQAQRQLRRANELEEEGEWDAAARLYDELLRHPRSAEFLYKAGEGHYRSVRDACRQRILALPPEGLAAYRDRVEPEAAAALEEAIRSGDLDGARLLVEKFPATAVAAGALEWSGAYSMDHGLFADAAWALSRQLEDPGLSREQRASISYRLAICHVRSGDPSGARAVRDRLRREGSGVVREGDDRVDALDLIEALLDQPKGAGGVGDEPRGGEAAGGGPADDASWDLLWAHEISDYYQRGESGPPPLVYPTAREGDVYFHDGNHAFRVGLSTGRLRWKTQLRPGGFSYRLPRRRCIVTYGAGSLFASIDGDSVVALDAETGEVRWRRDAQGIRDELELSFAVEISGSLAYHGGKVLAAATSVHGEKEVFLVALEAETGKPLWIRFIASRPTPGTGSAEIVQAGSRLYLVSYIGVAAAIDMPGGTLRWVRTREEAVRRPSVLASGATLHLLFAPGPDRRLEVEPHTGDLQRDEPAANAEELMGWMDGELWAAGRSGLFWLRPGGSRRIWKAEPYIWSRCALLGGHVVVPDASGLVRVDGEGKSGLLSDWRGGAPGNLGSAEGMILSATARGVFAYGVPGKERWELPRGVPIAELVRRLGDPLWGVRREADRRLRQMRSVAIPEISKGRESPEAEVRWRTEEIVYSIARRLRVETWRGRIPPFLIEKEPELLLMLTHRDREVRLEGLDTLSSEGGEEMAFLLRDLLQDRDGEIRFGAARGLLRLDDRSGMWVLIKNLGSESVEERRGALETLGEFGRREDAGRIRPLLSDKEGVVRLAAYRALVQRTGDLAISGEGLALMDDPDEFVRLWVINSAQNLMGRAAAGIRRKGMADESEAVRSEALDGLEKHFTPAVARAVAAALNDKSTTIANRAAEVLFAMVASERKKRDQEWAARVEEAAERNEEPGKMDMSVGHAIPMGALKTALGSKDEDLRYSVLQILESMRRNAAASALILAARDEDPRIQVRALRALFALAVREEIPKEDVPALCALLDLESLPARDMVSQILMRVPGPGATEALMDALGDPSKGIRERARVAVISRIDSKVIVSLLALSLNSEEARGQEAAKILRSLSRAFLAPGLIEGLQDGELEVRSEAIRLLRERTGKEMGYDPAAEDRSAAVRRWRSWWYKRTHPKVKPGDLVRDLGDPKPRVRHRAAHQAANLPEDDVIRALVMGLQGEEVRWVLEKMVEALRSTTGQEFGYDAKGTGEERKAAIAAWLRWWKERGS